MRPEKYRLIAEERKEVVVEKMKDVRNALIAYKSVKGSYADSFEKLQNFLLNDKMPIVIKTGTVPDTLTEAQALKKGIIKRDTILVEASKEVFKYKPSIDIKTLNLIPFSNESFTLKADTIVKGNIKVPVFEVTASKEHYLKGIDDDKSIKSGSFLSRLLNSFLYNNIEKQFQKSKKYNDLIMGSLTEPSTDGNWE